MIVRIVAKLRGLTADWPPPAILGVCADGILEEIGGSAGKSGLSVAVMCLCGEEVAYAGWKYRGLYVTTRV